MTHSSKRSTVMLVATATMLTGCGATPTDRAISGAGLGAAGGAIIGAATSVAILPATAIGAAVGGLTGLAISADLLKMLDDRPSRPRAVASDPRAVLASASGPKSTMHHARPAAAFDPQPSAAGQTETGSAAPASRDEIRDIQQKLDALGYNSGPVDGVAGPRTREAIRSYQQAHHMPVDGVATARFALAIDAEIARLTQLTRGGTNSAMADPE